MLTSGHRIQFGVDTKASPELIKDRVYAIDAVNRAFRGGINDTRPPFQMLTLYFENDKERVRFETGNVTGIYGYTGISPYTKTQIVVISGPYIFAGQLIGESVYFKQIYDKSNPSLLHKFFAQGESILVINDGKEDGLFWNGQTTQVKKVTDSPWILNNNGEKRGMPIGNICIYAHGRFWILTEDGILYAGDHLYSKGNNASDEVLLSFTESAYPASGDGFTATAMWGDARGLAVIPRDPSTNGHGEVICFHTNGAYAITPIDDRNQWTTQNIQQTVFSGHGGCSPWSIVTINNDLIFRKSDGRIATLRQIVTQKQNDFQIRSIGGEVEKYLQFDTQESIRYSMSGNDEERVLFTVGHEIYTDKETGYNHRFGNGLVVLDLSAGSISTPDSISWDGLWTGPRVTGIAQLVLCTERRCIFSSYDKDGKNRLYSLSRFRGDDFTYEGNKKVASMYSFGSMLNGIGTDSTSSPKVFTLIGSIISYRDCIDENNIEIDVRNEHTSNWSSFTSSFIGENPGDFLIYDMRSGVKSLSINGNCSVTEGRFGNSGSLFLVRTKISGTVKLTSNSLLADISDLNVSYSSPCADKLAGIVEDEYEYFQYQF